MNRTTMVATSWPSQRQLNCLVLKLENFFYVLKYCGYRPGCVSPERLAVLHSTHWVTAKCASLELLAIATARTTHLTVSSVTKTLVTKQTSCNTLNPYKADAAPFLIFKRLVLEKVIWKNFWHVWNDNDTFFFFYSEQLI